MSTRVHFIDPDHSWSARVTVMACQVDSDGWAFSLLPPPEGETTTNVSHVTCRACRRTNAARVARADDRVNRSSLVTRRQSKCRGGSRDWCGCPRCLARYARDAAEEAELAAREREAARAYPMHRTRPARPHLLPARTEPPP